MRAKLIYSALFSFGYMFFSTVFCQDESIFQQSEKKALDQTKLIITYILEFQPDSTHLDNKRAEEMILFSGNTHSWFLSFNEARNDSLRNESHRRAMADPSNIQKHFDYFTSSTSPTRFSFNIFKDHSENTITFIDRIWTDHYLYNEPMGQLQWAVIPQSQTKVLGIHVQRATVSYGGRNWEAWFAPGIPVNDGPYIFHGLPGLIIRIQDTQLHYVFSLVSIDVPHKDRPIEMAIHNPIKTSRKRFLQARENYRNNLIMYAQDAQLATESQIIIAENMRRRNNPIELKAD